MNNCQWYKKGDCGYFMPDSLLKCVGCEECCIYKEEQKVKNNKEVKLEGVGEDAEIVVNEKGGKQSKSPMAMHLIDPDFLFDWADNNAQSLKYKDIDDREVVDNCEVYDLYCAIMDIAGFMKHGDKSYIDTAIATIEKDNFKQITKIAKILQYGAKRYKANNWRLIPQEEHINHALIHVIAHLMGDKQDNHIDHALCRLMMAYTTDKSPNFEYGAYVE